MFIALLLAWAPSPALKLPSPPPLRPARCAVARRINEVRAAASVPRESVGGPIEALVTAVQGSQASALNAELVKAKDANAVLALTSARDAKSMNTVNVVTALHRLASIEKRRRAERESTLRDPRLAQLLDLLIERVADCSPRGVADVLWSCATLQHWPPILLKPVLTRVAGLLERKAFEPQHLSIMVWAMATLECKPVRLLEAIEQQAIASAGQLNAQNCANLAWGFARLNFRAEAFVPALCDVLASSASMISDFKPVEVADLAYGLTWYGDHAVTGDLLRLLAGRAAPESSLAQFSSRQLVTLMWAFARAKERPEHLDAWVASVRAAHEARPLLASDQRNVERSLGALGEDASWLRPEKEEEEGEEGGGQGEAAD